MIGQAGMDSSVRLHRIGFRYRLENSYLPGNPDLIDELDRINPGVPVFINSPPGIQITRLYQDMDDCWDRETKALKALKSKLDILFANDK
jgi:hypothetical protein